MFSLGASTSSLSTPSHPSDSQSNKEKKTQKPSILSENSLSQDRCDGYSIHSLLLGFS